jgi:hypothetical protein
MNMADTGISGAFPPSAITYSNVLSADEASAAKELLAARGVRLLPYPFASALAIASDVDSSRRHRYDGYVGQLVDELGLDFGDSTWLSWDLGVVGTWKGARRLGLGLGILTPWLTEGREVDAEIFENTRTFIENIAEFHKGNIDHFHAFFMRGIRVAPLTNIQADDHGRVTVVFDATQSEGPWACKSVCALGVCVVGAPNASLEVRRVFITTKDSVSVEYDSTPYAAPPGGRRHCLFSLPGPSDEERKAPLLDQIESVTIECALPEHGASVDRVLLLSAHTDLLVETLSWLRAKYNVEMSLITEHSRFHFSAISKNELYDPELQNHFDSYNGPIEAYNGKLIDADGGVIFSTHCDEPHAFGRVFPDFSRDLEFRFVNPIATMTTRAWDPLEVVTPSATRAGGGIYYARRTRPSAVEQPDPNRMDPTPTRQETFAIRVSNLLKDMALSPGLFCPLYTHLGSWTVHYEDKGKRDAVGAPLPVPYFDTDIMHALQDHVFNVTGSVPPASRVWFSRATTHYDYALMLRSIGDHVTRPGPDTIEITSWMDACLSKMMPRSAGQLYGLTFYVDDPAKAEVLLDGAPIEYLFRNPPDETGRSSVTIAACDLRYTVFDQCNPARSPMRAVESALRSDATGPLRRRAIRTGARWIWRLREGAERSFGRLWLSPAPKDQAPDRMVGAVRIPMFGWTATGAQAVSLLCRSSDRARFGVLLETRTGGRFYFGNEAAETFYDAPMTATYRLIPSDWRDDAWSRFTIPFHDLGWASDALPGGPMPNHPLESVTLFGVGAPETAIDFAEFAFLRPRTIARGDATNVKYCLGGRVRDFQVGVVVHALRVDDESWSKRETTVDQRGFFCFDAMDRGRYDVWARVQDAAVHDRRGRRVEVSEDNLTLVLGALDP